MKPKRSVALKGLQLPSLEQLLDEVMNYIPRETFDLANEANRERLRNWIRHVATRINNCHVDAMSDAVRQAVEDVGKMYVNPKHYEDRKKSLAASAERRKRTAAEKAERDAKTAVFGGRPMLSKRPQ